MVFQIKVEGCGPRFVIDIDVDNEKEFNEFTVVMLKKLIIEEKELGIEPNHLRLLFAGKQLESEKL